MRGKQEGWFVELFKLSRSDVCDRDEFGQKGWTNLIHLVSFRLHSSDMCSRLLTALRTQIETFVEENRK